LSSLGASHTQAGVRFDDELLHNAYQLLDVRSSTTILHEHLLLHSSRLFNSSRLVVQLPQGAVNTVLASSGIWRGWAPRWFFTQRWCGWLRTPLAAGLVCVFLVSPESAADRNWFFYSQLQMLLTALVLLGLADSPRAGGPLTACCSPPASPGSCSCAARFTFC